MLNWLASAAFRSIPVRVVDTLLLARRKHPMGPNSLDALCSRYAIDNSRRQKHGALLDSELLAEIYIELNGGRQAAMLLEVVPANSLAPEHASIEWSERMVRQRPLAPRITPADLEAHGQFIAALGEKAIWNHYS